MSSNAIYMLITPMFVSLATKGKLYNHLLPGIFTYISILHIKYNAVEKELWISILLPSPLEI